MSHPYHYTVGYWNTRAIGEPVRLMLELCVGGANWTDVRYQVGPPPHYSKSEWYTVKEKSTMMFPNLPWLKKETKTKTTPPTDTTSPTPPTTTTQPPFQLTQMHAIMRYLGKEFDMLGGTHEEQACVDMIVEAGRDWMNAFFDVTYCNAPWKTNEQPSVHVEGNSQCLKSSPVFEALRHEYVSVTLPMHLSRFEKLLKQSQFNSLWIAQTSDPTIADLILFEYIDQHFIFDSSSLPTVLLEYRQRCLDLPFMIKYRSSSAYQAEPLHNRYSHFHRGWM